MAGLVALDAAVDKLLNLVVHYLGHGLGKGHVRAAEEGFALHGDRLVDKEDKGRGGFSGYLCSIGLAGLQLLAHGDAKGVDVGDVLQGQKVSDHHLGLEERLLLLVEVEMLSLKIHLTKQMC